MNCKCGGKMLKPRWVSYGNTGRWISNCEKCGYGAIKAPGGLVRTVKRWLSK